MQCFFQLYLWIGAMQLLRKGLWKFPQHLRCRIWTSHKTNVWRLCPSVKFLVAESTFEKIELLTFEFWVLAVQNGCVLRLQLNKKQNKKVLPIECRLEVVAFAKQYYSIVQISSNNGTGLANENTLLVKGRELAKKKRLDEIVKN